MGGSGDQPENAEMPFLGGLYYLLLVGEMPQRDEALSVETEFKIDRREASFWVYGFFFCGSYILSNSDRTGLRYIQR
jgi:hypothetical protein